MKRSTRNALQAHIRKITRNQMMETVVKRNKSTSKSLTTYAPRRVARSMFLVSMTGWLPLDHTARTNKIADVIYWKDVWRYPLYSKLRLSARCTCKFLARRSPSSTNWALSRHISCSHCCIIGTENTLCLQCVVAWAYVVKNVCSPDAHRTCVPFNVLLLRVFLPILRLFVTSRCILPSKSIFQTLVACTITTNNRNI